MLKLSYFHELNNGSLSLTVSGYRDVASIDVLRNGTLVRRDQLENSPETPLIDPRIDHVYEFGGGSQRLLLTEENNVVAIDELRNGTLVWLDHLGNSPKTPLEAPVIDYVYELGDGSLRLLISGRVSNNVAAIDALRNGTLVWLDHLGNSPETPLEAPVIDYVYELDDGSLRLLISSGNKVTVIDLKEFPPAIRRETTPDIAPEITSSNAPTVQLPDSNNWPWWANVVLVASATIASSLGLAGLLVIAKNAYNHYMHLDNGDSNDRPVKKNRKRKQKGESERRTPLQFPMDSRNPLAFGPDGSSTINADPVMIKNNAQPYEECVPQYEQVDPVPYEQCVPQVLTLPQSEASNSETGEVVYDYATIPVPHGNLHQQPHSQTDSTYAQVDPDHVRRKKEQRRRKQQKNNEATETESTSASNPVPPAQGAEYHQLSEINTGASNSLSPSSQESGYMQPADAINPPPAPDRETQRRAQNPITRPADGVYLETANPARYHQQPEQKPDTLDGAPVEPGEPVYMNR